jgi:ribosome maturation factor RimP
MRLKEQVQEMVLKVLQDKPNLFFIGVTADEKNKHYRFIIDGDRPVNIVDLTSISREVSVMVDETIQSETPFTFDVSSPGADSPLVHYRQYPKHVGRRFEIDLNNGDKLKAVLKNANENSLVLETEKNKKTESGLVTIALKDIKESKIILSFK